MCTLPGDRICPGILDDRPPRPGGSGKTFAVTGGAQRFSAGILRDHRCSLNEQLGGYRRSSSLDDLLVKLKLAN